LISRSRIPLNDAALAAFRALEKRKKSRYVFLRTPGHGAKDGEEVRSPRAWFEDAVEEAKIENLTWHDLRHTFASRLVMAGVDIRKVAELMGHKTIQMTMRYAHLAPEHKLEAVKRLAAFAPKQKDMVTFSHRSVRRNNKVNGADRKTATETATGPNSDFRLTRIKAV
jgi:integrase